MSHAELLVAIECLRSEMNNRAAAGEGYVAVLEVDQELDKLIVKYHRAAE